MSCRVYRGPAHPVEPWFEALAALSGLIATHGKFNFLISDGIHLIAYGHDRLHYRERRENEEAEETWIATEPLTAEPWQPFERGELRIYRRGRLINRALTPRETVSEVVTNDRSLNAA